MAPCLSRMPDLCLEAIFRHLPLADLLDTVGLVCQSWYKSRATALKQRRRLVMMSVDELDRLYGHFIFSPHETELIGHVRREDGSPWCTVESRDRIKFNAVLLSAELHTVPLTTSLMAMSNITQLILIRRCPCSTLPLVIRLLDHVSAHLVQLKLKLYAFSEDATKEDVECEDWNPEDENADNQRHVLNLFDCLGRLQALEHLRLTLSTFRYVSKGDIHLVDKLLHLKTYAFQTVNVDEDQLYGSLSKLTSVHTIETNALEPVEEMLQLDTQLVSKVKALNVHFDKGVHADFSPMQLFAARFASLTVLRLYFERCILPLHLVSLARCLAQLHQLFQLYLRFNYDEVDEDGGQVVQEDAPQVHSVRLLTLDFLSQSHGIAQAFVAVPRIFPNIQVLQLVHEIIECPDCGIDPLDNGYSHVVEQSEPELAARLIECKRLSRQIFRDCVKLHTIAPDSYKSPLNLIITGPLITLNEL